MIQTQRSVKNIQTGEMFDIWENPITHRWVLIGRDSGEKLDRFYMCLVNCGITVKTREAGQLIINQGEFTSHTVTHYKFNFSSGSKSRFKKVIN